MAKKTKEDTQKTRTLLLDAAERMFLEKGVSKTTLTDIAVEAGMTRGAIYWHFANKRDVFLGLCERIRCVVTAPPIDWPTDENPLDVLKAHLIDNMGRCLNNPHVINLIRIIHQKFELNDDTEWMFVEMTNHLENSIDEVEVFLNKAIAEGFLPADYNARRVACALKAYQHGLMDSYLIYPHYYPLKEQLQSFMELFFNGLIPKKGK